ncbi:KH domain-containing protein akap-1-like [Adelges cooleyi]|uniref:KH domain-containing protein akap-1-like n=1 Tax=Adelges cooleyi TaxID=133065 RepID=UPI0021805B45|nr:KH domain-containing protein akap-1-like [Adelges cooleyi]XP_050431278.1 KH domain-containing protein akap-1-like [Adelges cooleyi]XP_050431286.1 KH domain-containing protein akap-1-like [Adelges cooleyi]
MFKVRTVSLGRILTFSTAVLYLGYLWYKRKRVLSHHLSDGNKSSSESPELNKINDQELIKALEKASRTIEVASRITEEESAAVGGGDSWSSAHQEEIMEPTISQVEIKEVETLVNCCSSPSKLELDTKVMPVDSNSGLSKMTVESLAEDLSNLNLNLDSDDKLPTPLEERLALEQSVSSPVVEAMKTSEQQKECWVEMIEKEEEDRCECPKAAVAAVTTKKGKKDEQPMLFEGIQFKGKKKRNRKKKPVKDTVVKLLPTESHHKVGKTSSIGNSVKPTAATKKTHQIVEEDCDSAHSVDHSIDTNDAPNTIYSDIRSVGSQDSGKGGSSYSGELHTISDADEQMSFDFMVPIDLVGPIIGKKGAFVKYIKEKSNVRLFVENKTESPEDKFKMCTLIGSEINIRKALKLIRAKFPEKTFPELTLECITPMMMDGGTPVISQLYKSELIEGVNNIVIITDVVAPDHFFVHNASTPDYALLSALNFAMNDMFAANKEDIPEVDLRTVTHGSVVATYSEGNWYRAQVIDVDEKKYESANVFFLDYGGCKKIDQCDMRPMHDTLVSLSFQAIECSLANVAPTYGKWCEESLKVFEALTTGKMLFAQVIYKSDSIQYVNLLAYDGLVTISVNDELVKYGFGTYMPNDSVRQIFIEPAAITEHDPLYASA